MAHRFQENWIPLEQSPTKPEIFERTFEIGASFICVPGLFVLFCSHWWWAFLPWALLFSWKNCTVWSQKCQRIGPGNENLCIFDQVLQSLFAPVGQPSRSMPQWISDLTWSNYRDIFVELVAMMVGWCWLMISLGIIYGTLYIGDYTSPWTGNPVLKHAVWREDRGCWTLLEWTCVIDAAKIIDEEELNIGWTQHLRVYVCLFYELKTLKLN